MCVCNSIIKNLVVVHVNGKDEELVRNICSLEYNMIDSIMWCNIMLLDL